MRNVYSVPRDALNEGVNGICLACGEIQYGCVEPDARGYPCEGCKCREVYGLEEAILMGHARLGGEEC